MTGAEAVLFTITIPTAVEEERLKEAYTKQLSDQTKTETSSATTLRLSESREEVPKSKNPPSIQIQAPSVELLEQLPLDTPQEKVLRQILRNFHIPNAVWLTNLEGNMYHISFSMEFDEMYEHLCEALQSWGIGDREGSSISVVSCLVHKSSVQINELGAEQQESSSINNIYAQKQGAWNRFMNSVRSRLNVARIVRDVRQDAAISFDFCILLVSAAILASFGLVENSTIFLASSMLISPLMGPNIAAIFGTAIKDRSLRRLGMVNELVGILMATLVGFLFGLIICTTDERYGIGEGLTDEMLSRCDLHSLIVGVFTAIPSGAAAAISILGGNFGSLVGVAISASLLPPAVNSGLLWSLACIYKFFENDQSLYVDVIKSRKYSEDQAKELAILGSISMCLTLSNVLCIYVMGILVLKVKEIAPVIGRKNSQFWKHDIKLARNGLPKVLRTEAEIIDEMLANMAKEDQQALGLQRGDFLRHLDASGYQHTWSPLSQRHSLSRQSGGEMGGCHSTIHRLEQLYTSSVGNAPTEGRRQRLSFTNRPSLLVNELSLPEETRPRFGSMPHTPADTTIQMPMPRRFTVTPAREN